MRPIHQPCCSRLSRKHCNSPNPAGNMPFMVQGKPGLCSAGFQPALRVSLPSGLCRRPAPIPHHRFRHSTTRRPLTPLPHPPKWQNRGNCGKRPLKQVCHQNRTQLNKRLPERFETILKVSSAPASNCSRPSMTSSRLAPAAGPRTPCPRCCAHRLLPRRCPRRSMSFPLRCFVSAAGPA